MLVVGLQPAAPGRRFTNPAGAKQSLWMAANLLMRIAIVHYHLRPGGVTRVIQNAVSTFSAEDLRYVVIAGEGPSPSMPVPQYATVEALGYAQTASSRPIREIVKELETAAAQALDGKPDVWHIHNHALGKNLVLSEVVYLLAQEGRHLLLQPHDFAEDGRPENYRLLRDNLCLEDPRQLGRAPVSPGRACALRADQSARSRLFTSLRRV